MDKKRDFEYEMKIRILTKLLIDLEKEDMGDIDLNEKNFEQPDLPE